MNKKEWLFQNLFVLFVMDIIIICFFGGGIIGFFLIDYTGFMNNIYGLIIIIFGIIATILILLIDKEKKKKIKEKEEKQ